MGTKRRTEISIETDRLLVISRRRRRRAAVAQCTVCGPGAGMITVDEAATLARASAWMIYRLAGAGQLHFTETPEGSILICLRSLFQRGNEQASLKRRSVGFRS
ncbi:MAG: hypothetical protein LC672_01015 [Acidobacteria bacterium]|nr:hypothetical protein [Acidobacteriota bacterium]